MDAFTTFLAAVRPPIEGALDRLLPPTSVPPTHLHEALRYSIFAGGKRIRPALVLLAGEVFGVERAILLPGGAALEMIHTYSLIHDDLPAMDDDDLRRGRPTLHRRYDEPTAILAGDALLTLGLTTLAAHPMEASAEQRRQAVEVVGEAIGTRGMIGGQIDDIAAEQEWPKNAPEVLATIHRRKTGALLTTCLRLGGIYANVDEEQDRRLSALGDRLGMMFQIADDILDIEGTAATLGKTAGKDVAARKLTYPGLYGLDESKKMLARVHDEASELAHELPEHGGLFRSLVHFLQARDR